MIQTHTDRFESTDTWKCFEYRLVTNESRVLITTVTLLSFCYSVMIKFPCCADA